MLRICAESAGSKKVTWSGLSEIQVAQAPQDVIAKLLSAQADVCQSLVKSPAIGNQLDQSNKRLQNVLERVSPVRRVLVPMKLQPMVTGGWRKGCTKP